MGSPAAPSSGSFYGDRDIRDMYVIVLDDEPLSLMMTVDLLGDLGFQKVEGFRNDLDAGNFILEHGSDIVGVVQDLSRPGPEFPPPGLKGLRSRKTCPWPLPNEGGAFYFHVIDLMIPWVNTLFASGYLAGEYLFEPWAAQDCRIAALGKPYVGRELRSLVSAWAARQGEPISAATRLVEPVNEEWAFILARQPELMDTMSPRRFEEFVAFIFENHGFRTELTAPTRDGGYDLRAVHPNRSNEVMLVEVKRYSRARTVGVGVLRSLYGVGHLHGGLRTALVTSSFVSPYAKQEFARAIPLEMEIWEFDRLTSFCEKFASELVEPPTARSKA